MLSFVPALTAGAPSGRCNARSAICASGESFWLRVARQYVAAMRHAVGALRRPTRGKRLAPNRNGARHCCQAPLRRAKDLPVFVTLIHEPEGPKTRPRSWRTSSGVASHRGRPQGLHPTDPYHFPREASGPEDFAYRPKVSAPRCSAALLGLGPFHAACLPGGETALVQGSTSSSGASCRLVRKSVRRVIAPKDSSAANLIPSPAGGDRSFRLAAPSCRCRPSGEAGTSVPITHEPCTMNPSRAKRKMRAQACG